MSSLAIELRAPSVFVENVVPHLLAWRRAGHATALATIVAADGSAPRPVGSQMAVRDDGTWVGQLTSGCAEAAIAAEAVQIIRDGTGRTERYGRGSRYMDVRLPCGSGIDVHFDPSIETSTLEALARGETDRRALTLSWSREGAPDHRVEEMAHPPVDARAIITSDGERWRRHYVPTTRVMLCGRGPIVSATAGFARLLGWQVAIATPESELMEREAPGCVSARHLTRPEEFDPSPIDRWTASVMLFHDHEWEPPILVRILTAGGFYVGALGSNRTHAARLDALRELGLSKQLIDQVRGPVGLDIGARNPVEIALSITGEILAARRAGSWNPST
ncbi:MAG: XdhC family protein [Rhizobiales bacterium]|nr:XdhC family protein [Hyphomicrobiales bacterium]